MKLSSNILMQSLVVAVFLILLTVLLWLPFGTNTGFWADDWVSLNFARIGINISLASSRPLVFAPWLIAYKISPDLAGANLLAIAMIAGRGILCYGIFRLLRLPLALSGAIAVLAIVFPADDAQFYLGALSIHVALFGYLTALFFMLLYFHTRNLLCIIGIFVGLLVCIGIYEAGYPLIFVTPLLMLTLEKKFTRRFFITCAVWYLIPILNLLRVLSLYLSPGNSLNYQSSLLLDNISIQQIATQAILNYKRHLWDVWVSLSLHIREFRYLAIAAAVIVVILIVYLLVNQKDRSFKSSHAFLWFVIGLLAIGLGFSAYLPTSLANETNRTFYFSSVGGALALAALAYGFTYLLPERFANILFPIIIGGLCTVASFRMLDQHAKFVRLTIQQRSVVTDMLTQVGRLQPNTALIVFDESDNDDLKNIFVGSSFYLNPIVNLVYDDSSIDAALCYPGQVIAPSTFRETCELRDGAVIVEYGGQQNIYPYDRLIAFRNTEEGIILLDDLSTYTSDIDATDYAPSYLHDQSVEYPGGFFSILGYPFIR